MPPTGTRGRRGRGRAPWKRDQGRPPPTTTDTELESQQQQSSNRTPSLREPEVKADEKKWRLLEKRDFDEVVFSVGLAQSRRGGKRKGRPPSRGGRNRGRLSREPPAADAVAPTVRRVGYEHETLGSAVAHGSGQDVTGTTLLPSGRSRRRVTQTKLQDMGAESEGENDVSEMEGSQRRTESGTMKSSAHEEMNEDHSAKKGKPRDASQMEFSFSVFTDGKGVIRAEHATYVLPICVGSIAFWLGKKAPEKKCYRWVVYVRSPGGVDLSHVIRRVKFQLHPSFTQPERIVEQAPYELEETGWGEFEIGVTIEFHEDAAGSPVAMTHSLKLYTTSEPSTRRPVVDEKYDEIVFSEPPAVFFQKVRNQDDHSAPRSRYDTLCPRYNSHLVDDCMHRINLVKSRIRNEVRGLMAKADANGIKIDLPAAAKLMEQSQQKDVSFAKPSPAETMQEAKYTTDTRRKTHIVIDADQPDRPLRLERELPKKRAIDKGGEEDQEKLQVQSLDDADPPLGNTPRADDPASSAGGSDGAGRVDHMPMELDGDILEGVPEDPGIVEEVPFGMEEFGSKGSSKGNEEPAFYEEVSSSGECQEQRDDRRMELDLSQELGGLSEMPEKQNSSDPSDTPKASGSSSGAASGNQEGAFDDVANDDL